MAENTYELGTEVWTGGFSKPGKVVGHGGGLVRADRVDGKLGHMHWVEQWNGHKTWIHGQYLTPAASLEEGTPND